jgi:hypothetical protein
LAKPNAEGAAAQIKKEEAEAKARAAAVRYLGTVDCHWWPDAEVALSNALRADKNECVRYEAALALGRGCCCTKAIVRSLTICVNGTEEDGNPYENSERVRMAAEVALMHCVSVAPVKVEGGEKTGETGGEKKSEKKPDKLPEKAAQQGEVGEDQHLQLAAYYVKQQSLPWAQIIEEARRAVDKAGSMQAQTTTLPTGRRSLADIWERANAGSEVQETIPSTPPPMPVILEAPREVIPAVHAEKYGGLLPALFRDANETLKPAVGRRPASEVQETVPTTPPPMPVVRETPREVVPAVRTEKNGGLLPALFRDTNETPKPAVGWRPATVTIEATPTAPPPVAPVAPLAPIAPTPVKEPTHKVAPATPVSDAEWLSVPKLLSVLKDSHTPAQREWAADCLGAADCKSNAMVLPSLMTAARSDSAPAVRIACIHALVKLHATGSDVLGTLRSLASDKDVNVQKEASQALTAMGVGKLTSGIQKVGGTSAMP